MRQVVVFGVSGLLALLCAGGSAAVNESCMGEFAGELQEPVFEPPWPLGADLNGDWALDAFDLIELAVSLGPCDEPCPGDLDGSDTIDLIDLLMLLSVIDPEPQLAVADD